MPIVLQPSRTTHALLGALAVSACAVGLYLVAQALREAPWVGRVRRLSKHREWALDLRLALLVLFGLAWLATRIGTSILIAGFAVGLVVAATEGPKRLSRQVTGVAQGFFVPLFFVVLGARIDVRALHDERHPDRARALLIAFNVGLSLAAALVTRQTLAAGTRCDGDRSASRPQSSRSACSEGIISPGVGAAIMVAALASIATSGARRLAPPPAAPADDGSGLAGAAPQASPRRARGRPSVAPRVTADVDHEARPVRPARRRPWPSAS